MRRTILASVILAAVTLAVYSPACFNGFVYFDDNWYVSENAVVQRGLTTEGLAWAFTNQVPYWQPVTWLSHLLDCQLFGVAPGGHHLVNVLIHTANSVLLLLLLLRMTGDLWRSAIVASFFALHPLHVESVAWVAERKDVLGALFFFLALLAWTRYAGGRGWGWYWLALAIFALGLLTKPTVVTLPFVMLLLDWWPLRRLRAASCIVARWEDEPQALQCQPARVSRLLLEKIPFFILTIAATIVTLVICQRATGVIVSLQELPIQSRLANSVVGYARYTAKTFWPSNLAVYYDQPAGADLWLVAGAVLLLVVTFASIRTARSRPSLIVGWFWYLGMLVPAIGIVQVWWQSIADRFMYLPIVGLLIMVAWSVPRAWTATRVGQQAVGAIAAVLLAILSVVTWRQLHHWRSTLTLFERAAAVTVNNRVAMNNLAWIYSAHPDPATRRESEALRLATRLCELTGYQDSDYLDTLAVAYAAAGRFPDAVATAKRAVWIASTLSGKEAAAPLEARLGLYVEGRPYVEHNHLITGAAPESPQ